MQTCNCIKKETSTQVFSCEYCKTFKTDRRVIHGMITNDSIFTTSDKFSFRLIFLFFFFFFFLIWEAPITKHPKVNSLNLKEDLKRKYWTKTKNKPLRRNVNGNKQELRQFFASDTYNYKNLWRYYDTKITEQFLPRSVLVTLVSIHIRFPRNIYQGEEKSRENNFN